MKLRSRLTYANVVATFALLVALVGIPAAVAVTKSSKSDINGKGIIRAGRVTTSKLADGAVTASKTGPIDVVEAAGVGSAFASCAQGERLIGGGAKSTTAAPLTFSAPSGSTWGAGAQAGSASVTAYALCLRG